jgi:hypothetical protein
LGVSPGSGWDLVGVHSNIDLYAVLTASLYHDYWALQSGKRFQEICEGIKVVFSKMADLAAS